MYLQITTKCNMHCAHCCYSCSMRGKHGEFHVIAEAIHFASQFGDEAITIGGGEPTLHPQFFYILEKCLDNFSYVWMATNGSQTSTMYRLANIINGEDRPDCECTEEEIDNDECTCMDNGIYQEGKLSVALSQDYFHDEIDIRIVDLWTNKVKNRQSGFEIRNVAQSSSGVAAEGRAKKTGSGWSDHCVCNDIVIKPNGKLKLCGCTKSPVIGDIRYGIDEKWEKRMWEEKYQDERCYKSLRKGGKK